MNNNNLVDYQDSDESDQDCEEDRDIIVQHLFKCRWSSPERECKNNDGNSSPPALIVEDVQDEEDKQPTEHLEKSTEHLEKPTEHLEKPTEHLEKPTEHLEKPTEHLEKKIDDPEKQKHINEDNDDDDDDEIAAPLKMVCSAVDLIKEKKGEEVEENEGEVVEEDFTRGRAFKVLKLQKKDLGPQLGALLKELKEFFTKTTNLDRPSPAIAQVTILKVQERLLCKYHLFFHSAFQMRKYNSSPNFWYKV